ncbi:MAG: sporulation transcription factor Spo0A [Clostridia bacterium]|nr:sporulation transcription factor Spo0A [Clostridia bacterium]
MSEKIAIFENNEELLNELQNCISSVEGYEVCAASANGNEAIELVKKTCPNVAIVDLVLTGLDGFGVLDYVRENYPECLTVALGGFKDDKIVDRAIEHGAVYYLAKPVSPQTVLDRIKDLSGTKVLTYKVSTDLRGKRKASSLDEKISNIFITIGIPPHIKGFSYLREGIKLAVSDPSIINKVTKELYPRIAEKYATSPSKVERAIRHAIEVAWNRGRADAISSIFGARVYIGNERPTNSEFIALVADKLILESL